MSATRSLKPSSCLADPCSDLNIGKRETTCCEMIAHFIVHWSFAREVPNGQHGGKSDAALGKRGGILAHRIRRFERLGQDSFLRQSVRF